MRIHVSFIDRVGITQEVLALLGGRNLNLDAVEMVPPNVYIDAPTLSAAVLDELREALFKVRGVQAVTIVDILPGQRRRLQLDALLAAMTDPVLAVDSEGRVLLANPALIALCEREVKGCRSVNCSPTRPCTARCWSSNSACRCGRSPSTARRCYSMPCRSAKPPAPASASSPAACLPSTRRAASANAWRHCTTTMPMASIRCSANRCRSAP